MALALICLSIISIEVSKPVIKNDVHRIRNHIDNSIEGEYALNKYV